MYSTPFDLSFSYLRSAVEASLDIKRFSWNQTFASYSHVSVHTQTPFIWIIRFIFASKYSQKFSYNYSIWFEQIHVEAIIRFRANICFIFSYTNKYSLQNIRFGANICKTSSKFHIQANICLYTNIRIQANIRYIMLQNIQERLSQVLGLN